MKILLLLIYFISLLFGQTIDADKSSVNFLVRNMGVRDVVGTIADMQGIAKFDVNYPDSTFFDVTVNVYTINTNNKKRDDHLINEDFFDTEKWPTIRFKSTDVTKNDSTYSMTGTLTIKDITKQVSVPFSFAETDSTISLIGSEIVNRLDYNIGVNYNNFKIGYEVTVEVNCTLFKN